MQNYAFKRKTNWLYDIYVNNFEWCG